MSRDYRDMLEAAEELARDFGGYLSGEGLARRNAVQARFDGARRAFVYDAFRTVPDKAALWPTIAAEIDELEVSTHYSDEAFDQVREALRKHIGGQMNAHAITRFAIRWGPPAGAAALGLAYLATKIWVIT